MKLSLDCVGYGGYFTNGEQIPAEEALERAARFGYDAMCIYAHRPIGFPMDFRPDRRKRLKERAEELDMELGAVVCCTNFMKGDHVLLYPQEKEILYVRDAIQFAKEIGYDGYLSHEQCSPMIVKGHRIADLHEVDQRYLQAIRFFKPLLKRLECYTGHKELSGSH